LRLRPARYSARARDGLPGLWEVVVAGGDQAGVGDPRRIRRERRPLREDSGPDDVPLRRLWALLVGDGQPRVPAGRPGPPAAAGGVSEALPPWRASRPSTRPCSSPLVTGRSSRGSSTSPPGSRPALPSLPRPRRWSSCRPSALRPPLCQDLLGQAV